MALVIDGSREVPDNKGGWYWMKWAGGDWEPIKVDPAKDEESVATFRQRNSQYSWYATPVSHPCVRWGPQIFPPNK